MRIQPFQPNRRRRTILAAFMSTPEGHGGGPHDAYLVLRHVHKPVVVEESYCHHSGRCHASHVTDVTSFHPLGIGFHVLTVFADSTVETRVKSVLKGSTAYENRLRL